MQDCADTIIMSLDEDPTSFLARMKQAYPEIQSILTPKQVKLLRQDPSDPYAKENANEEYLSELSSYYLLHQKCKEVTAALRDSLLKPTSESVDVENFKTKKDIMEKVKPVLCGPNPLLIYIYVLEEDVILWEGLK